MNRPDLDGSTPLDLALANSNVDLVRLLLACGADPARGKGPPPYGRPGQEATDLVTEARRVRQHPLPMLEPTAAICPHPAYALAPGSLLGWSSEAKGRLTGPLEWSRTPSGRAFFGPFGQQAVTLRLTDLPRHRNVRVEIDLFVIGSWDGNGGQGAGPDILDVRMPGVGTALHATFFNTTEGDAAGLPMQSFPDAYLDGFHRGYTGAAEVRTLGFVDHPNGSGDFPRDAVYRLGWTFAHEGSDLTVVVTGLNVPQPLAKLLAQDERWGIGGLRVFTD